MIGWILAFISAGGNTGNDVCKKWLMARGISKWETIALLNGFGGFLNMAFCIATGNLPKKFEMAILIGGFLTMLGKVAAQYTYLKALSLAPLSHVIPYLAWNPVFLLIVGALLLDEKPTIWGIIGCLIVVFGAYLISIDAKQRDAKAKTAQKKEDQVKYEGLGDNAGAVAEPKKDFFLIGMLKAIWNFKAGLFMMFTGIAWTYTSALEKHILQGSGIPKPYFLGIQRIFMSIPVMFYCMGTNPKFIDHTFSSFFPLLLTAIVESMQVLTYFWAIDSIFVSYVIAVKRAGNIFLSVMVGRFYYGEKLSTLTICSAGCMILGVLFIVLG